MIYCKAKYCSLLHRLPLLYKPFPHSELLRLHAQEIRFTPELNKQLPHKILVPSADVIAPAQVQTLFITDLFTTFSGNQPTNPAIEILPVPYWMNFWPDEIYAIMQMDSSFKQVIQTMLSPVNTGPALSTPSGTISVAIHVRKGGRVDSPLSSPQLYDKNHPELYQTRRTDYRASDKKFPLRFPPEQFYVDQLNFLASLLDENQLSVFVFTDDNNPSTLLSHFSQQCRATNIHFVGIYCSPNFIDDLILMAQCDCLIRPCSHFSGVAQLMGNHKVIIRPEQFVWHGSLLLISETTAILHNQTTTECLPFTNASSVLLKDKMNTLFFSQRK